MIQTDQIREELLALRAESEDGMLHAETAVEWARTHRKSALHSQLEWDDAKAGAEYRLWQMRRLVQIHVVTEIGKPQLVSLRFDRSRGGGYRQIVDVLTSEKLSARMLSDALADLDRVRERYEYVQELVSVWDAVDQVKKRRAGRQQKEPPRATA